MSDFLTEDVDDLLNTPVESTEEKEDINTVLLRFDRDLMDFKTNVGVTRLWPESIRKRLCTK